MAHDIQDKDGDNTEALGEDRAGLTEEHTAMMRELKDDVIVAEPAVELLKRRVTADQFLWRFVLGTSVLCVLVNCTMLTISAVPGGNIVNFWLPSVQFLTFS